MQEFAFIKWKLDIKIDLLMLEKEFSSYSNLVNLQNYFMEGSHMYKETKRIIKSAILENKLVIFVGASVSANSGVPLWGAAVSKIKERLEPEFINQNDYLNFKLFWLKLYNRNLITIILKQNIVKTNIANCFKKQYQEAGLDKKELEIYFNYFL